LPGCAVGEGAHGPADFPSAWRCAVIPDIGLVEMVVIGLVLFLVVGPDRLPEVYAQLSRLVGQARLWLEEARRALRDEAEQVREPVVQAREAMRREIADATQELAEIPEAVLPVPGGEDRTQEPQPMPEARRGGNGGPEGGADRP